MLFCDPTNQDRADWAKVAVRAFQSVCRTDECDAIGDLMCNLLHLARERGLTPEQVLDSARNRFVAEEAEATQCVEKT